MFYNEFKENLKFYCLLKKKIKIFDDIFFIEYINEALIILKSVKESSYYKSLTSELYEYHSKKILKFLE